MNDVATTKCSIISPYAVILTLEIVKEVGVLNSSVFKFYDAWFYNTHTHTHNLWLCMVHVL